MITRAGSTGGSGPPYKHPIRLSSNCEDPKKKNTQKPISFIAPGQLAKNCEFGKKTSNVEHGSKRARINERKNNDFGSHATTGGHLVQKLVLHYNDSECQEETTADEISYMDLLRMCEKLPNINSTGFCFKDLVGKPGLSFTDGVGRELRNDNDVLALMKEHEGLEYINVHLFVSKSLQTSFFQLPEENTSSVPRQSQPRDVTMEENTVKVMAPSTRQTRRQHQLRDENFNDPLDDINRENDLSQDDHANREEEIQDGPVRRKTRGGTLMKHIWGVPQGFPKRNLESNRFGQPVGVTRRQFSEFLATISRNGYFCPINVDKWPHMPEANKDQILKVVKEKFEVPPYMDGWILKTVGNRWKAWKSKLRTEYKDQALPYNQKTKQMEERVQLDQWTEFKELNNTKKAKDLAATNKAVRSQKTMNHHTGKTSFAEKAHIWEKKNNAQPSRATMFKECYTDRSGNPKCDKVAITIAAMDERSSKLQPGQIDELSPSDVFGQVIGKERNGRVRMIGTGVAPSDVWGVLPSRNTLHRLLTEKDDAVEKLSTLVKEQGAQIMKLQEMMTQHVNSPPSTSSTRRPLQVGAIVVMKSMSDPSKTVAKGILQSLNPSDVVGGNALGKNWCEVLVQVVVEASEGLIRPYDIFEMVGDVIGCPVAWPCQLVDLE